MMPQDGPEARTLARLVTRHLGTAPGDVRLRRIPTGKFNTSYLVDGGPVPHYRRRSLRLAEGLERASSGG